MTFRRCLAFFVILAFATSALADAPKPSAKHLELVQSLGNKSFRIRRLAESKLLALGLNARPALKAALTDPDLEVRLRSHNILLRISQSETEKKLDAFIKGDKKVGEKLPGWKQLKSVIGDAPASRQLYVRMVRAESDLFDAFHSESAVVTNRFQRRLDTIRYSGFNRQGGKAGVDSVAAILVVATMSRIQLSSSQVSNLYYLLVSQQYKTYLDKGPAAGQLKKIIEYWMVRNSSGLSSYYMLQMAMRLNLKKGGLKIARRTLRRRRSTYSYTMLYAALVIGRFGDKKNDIPILERQLGNSFVCYRSNRKTIQVRDVCLAVLVHLTGQNHKTYGFKGIRKSSQTLFFYTSVNFANDADRQKGIAKWRKWSKANLKQA